jgi:hypothetical protein
MDKISMRQIEATEVIKDRGEARDRRIEFCRINPNSR